MSAQLTTDHWPLTTAKKFVGPTRRLSSQSARAWDRCDGNTSAGVVTGRSAAQML